VRAAAFGGGPEGVRPFLGGERRPTLALRIAAGARGPSRSLAWRNADLRSYLVSPVVCRGRLIGLSETRRRLVCVDLATGRTVWVGEGGYPQYASLVVAGDRLLVLRSDGELEVVRADREEFAVAGRWTVAASGGTWSHLAVAGSWLYVKDAGTLRCFDLAAGQGPRR
jgi:hypothetical protein